MKKGFITLVICFLILPTVFTVAQRSPGNWDKRSPEVGKKIPNIDVYDENLNKIPLSKLYKKNIIVIQWGGCT